MQAPNARIDEARHRSRSSVSDSSSVRLGGRGLRGALGGHGGPGGAGGGRPHVWSAAWQASAQEARSPGACPPPFLVLGGEDGQRVLDLLAAGRLPADQPPADARDVHDGPAARGHLARLPRPPEPGGHLLHQVAGVEGVGGDDVGQRRVRGEVAPRPVRPPGTDRHHRVVVEQWLGLGSAGLVMPEHRDDQPVLHRPAVPAAAPPIGSARPTPPATPASCPGRRPDTAPAPAGSRRLRAPTRCVPSTGPGTPGPAPATACAPSPSPFSRMRCARRACPARSPAGHGPGSPPPPGARARSGRRPGADPPPRAARPAARLPRPLEPPHESGPAADAAGPEPKIFISLLDPVTGRSSFVHVTPASRAASVTPQQV